MKGQTNSFVLEQQLQRDLRRNMTDAERTLWHRLRGKQMDTHKFRRQHPYGNFILDFVCMDAMLVIEIDGGQHANSSKDAERDAALVSAGFRVLRFWNNQVLNELDGVLAVIWSALESHPHPHPNPPLEGEGTNVKNEKPQAHPNLPLEGEGTNVKNEKPQAHPSPPLVPARGRP